MEAAAVLLSGDAATEAKKHNLPFFLPATSGRYPHAQSKRDSREVKEGDKVCGEGEGGREVECGGRKRVSSTILIRDVRAFCVWEEEEEEEGVGKLTQ